jgi:predicted GH43/DUF377 family glycosyl hydrolase
MILTNCAFRSIIKNSEFHIFEEVPKNDLTFSDNPLVDPIWYIAKRTSEDGIKFSDRSESLIERTRFDIHGQADPTVLIDGIWRMYYDCLNEYHEWERIGLALSTDGDRWVKYGPVLRRGGIGTWDDKSVHHPVILKQEKYYLFYSGSSYQDKHIVRSIGLATSKDGLHFTKHPLNPLITPGNDWDRNYCRPSRPFLIDRKWYMLYWGFNGSTRNIGLATSDDLIFWSKHGILIENATASDIIVDDNINVWFTRFVSPDKNYLHFKSIDKQQLKQII